MTRLETLAFALHFYTPSSDEYTCKLREALLSANMGAPLSSLIFRAMLKCFSKIVIKYPLVFDARWLEVCFYSFSFELLIHAISDGFPAYASICKTKAFFCRA